VSPSPARIRSTIASVVDQWEQRYKDDAQVNGYTVK